MFWSLALGAALAEMTMGIINLFAAAIVGILLLWLCFTNVLPFSLRTFVVLVSVVLWRSRAR